MDLLRGEAGVVVVVVVHVQMYGRRRRGGEDSELAEAAMARGGGGDIAVRAAAAAVVDVRPCWASAAVILVLAVQATSAATNAPKAAPRHGRRVQLRGAGSRL